MSETVRIAVVRAIPNLPHKRRWCGLERWVADPAKRPQQEMEEIPTGGFRPKFDAAGKPIYAKHALPWPDSEVKVRVVDSPAPFDPDANGGVPVEISPSTLVMLERDPRIAVTVLDGSGGNPADVIRAKGAAAEAEERAQDAARQLADLQEHIRLRDEEHAKALAAQKASFEAEMASLRAQLTGGGNKKK